MSGRLNRIETLVWGLIIVMGFGLILPTLYAEKAKEQRVTCTDNLRKLSLGFSEYEKAKGGLPPRRGGFNNGEPYSGWGSALLPYLTNDTIAQKYNPKLDFFDPANQSIVEKPYAFQCPAAPGDRFVTITSQASTKSANNDKDTVFTSKSAACDYIASNGVLLPRGGYAINFNEAGQMNGNTRQPMADNEPSPLSKITDGTAYTLLLIEQAGRPEVWRHGKKKDGEGQFGMSPNARGSWAGWGSIAFGPSDAVTGESPGKGDATDCTVNCNNWFGIYGFHQQGANVLMCDGSVRFMSPKIDPLTFAYLTLRDDGHVISDRDVE